MKILHPEPLESWRLNGHRAEWIIKPFLMRSSSLMLYGRPGLGKTTLALQLAAALTGEQKAWLDFPVKTVGPVLWLQLDMPRLEMAAMLERAITAKLFTPKVPISFLRMYDVEDDENVAAPLKENEEVFDFNLLLRSDYEALCAIVQRMEPVALFVDTVGDAYYSLGQKGINEEIRDVLRRLRNLMRPNGGAVIYLHHQRKRNPQFSGDDPDEFLGGMAWAGFASTSLQLVKVKRDTEDEEAEERFSLFFRKLRLGTLGFEHFQVEKGTDGFFRPRWTAKQGILLWDEYLKGQWGGLIYETLSSHLAVSEESLRQAASRLKRAGTL